MSRYAAARTKKVPGYNALGRSACHVPWRPYEDEFWEKMRKSEKGARRSKIFRLKRVIEGRFATFLREPLNKNTALCYMHKAV